MFAFNILYSAIIYLYSANLESVEVGMTVRICIVRIWIASKQVKPVTVYYLEERACPKQIYW
jgi:hypothetical protein